MLINNFLLQTSFQLKIYLIEFIPSKAVKLLRLEGFPGVVVLEIRNITKELEQKKSNQADILRSQSKDMQEEKNNKGIAFLGT